MLEEDWWLPNVLEGASVHIYLISAILALWRWPSTLSLSLSWPWLRSGDGCRDGCLCEGCNTTTVALESTPAIVAGIGKDASLGDCKNKRVISIPWYSDAGSLETLGDALFGISSVVDVCLQDVNVDEVCSWQVASSLMWTIDALLTLRGDLLRYRGGEIEDGDVVRCRNFLNCHGTHFSSGGCGMISCLITPTAGRQSRYG